MTATYAEASAYLYTASLEAPMYNDWTQIYLYVTVKVVSRGRDTKIPGDIRETRQWLPDRISPRPEGLDMRAKT